MNRRFQIIFIAAILVKVRCKEPELPLCPTNIQFLPQNMPMHCRLPASAKISDVPGPPPPGFPFPPPGQSGIPVLPPGMPPGMPQGMPFPLPPGMPGPMPMPMPMPMPAPGPDHKLPVIVMPFYSPDPSFKKGPNRKRQRMVDFYKRRPFSSEETTSSDTDSSDSSHEVRHSSWWRKRARNMRRSGQNGAKKHKHIKHKRAHEDKELLTPVLQYVTKDGYVIYEKQITKTEAKDWLSMRKENKDEVNELKPPESVEVVNNNAEVAEPEEDPDADIVEPRKEKEQVEASTWKPPRRHRTHGGKPSRNHRTKAEDKSKESFG